MRSELALDRVLCARALESRDPRFDGVFFVGIRTTMIYCRPICPSRLSRPDRRSFFATAAAAERHGYRPCLRCRPELAPGRASVDAVSRVARAAAARIAAGALNGTGVVALAAELGVSERHLRRAMERESGVSPAELAQTQRLLLAKCLLTDTALPITEVAFASGFQSLRRFNTVFRDRYRMPPSALRRRRPRAHASPTEPVDRVRLRLPYRPPLAWTALLETLAADACAGVEVVRGAHYARTVSLDGCRGVMEVTDTAGSYLAVELTVSLLPALMPLLARLRHLFDLDAEPGTIRAHLTRGGLGALVAREPGLRVPGAFDGFEAAMRELVPERNVLLRLVARLGEPAGDGAPGLERLWPTPARVLRAGAGELHALGLDARSAERLLAVAHALARGTLSLRPGADFDATTASLEAIARVGPATAAAIACRALHWPDAPPVPGSDAPDDAEQWRPWRTYAAAHLAREAWRTRTPHSA